MNVKPLLNRIAVREIKTDSIIPGFVMPRQPPQGLVFGDVVAVGPGMPLMTGIFHTPSVKVGDKIAFMKQSSMPLVIDSDGEKVALEIMREEDILAIIEE